MPTNTTESTEVVRWYTRARRFPQMIGKTATGGNIWGGPYTYTQVGVGVGALVLGLQTTWLWGHFGLLGNTVLLAGVSYGLAVLTGKLPIGSRNPLSMATGAFRALGAPAQGTLGGAPLRIRRPRLVRSRVVITHDAPTLDDIQAPAPAPERPPHSGDAADRLPSADGPATPRRLRPTPASTRTAATPALSGVQRLLASAVGSPRQED